MGVILHAPRRSMLDALTGSMLLHTRSIIRTWSTNEIFSIRFHWMFAFLLLHPSAIGKINHVSQMRDCDI